MLIIVPALLSLLLFSIKLFIFFSPLQSCLLFLLSVLFPLSNYHLFSPYFLFNFFCLFHMSFKIPFFSFLGLFLIFFSVLPFSLLFSLWLFKLFLLFSSLFYLIYMLWIFLFSYLCLFWRPFSSSCALSPLSLFVSSLFLSYTFIIMTYLQPKERPTYLKFLSRVISHWELNKQELPHIANYSTRIGEA